MQGRANRSRSCYDVTKGTRGLVTSNALRVKESENSDGQAGGGSRLQNNGCDQRDAHNVCGGKTGSDRGLLLDRRESHVDYLTTGPMVGLKALLRSSSLSS